MVININLKARLRSKTCKKCICVYTQTGTQDGQYISPLSFAEPRQ